MPWLWLRRHGALAAFALLMTLHEGASAYGVVHIDAFSIWWWVVEGISTPAWNVAGFAVVLAGMRTVAFQSR